MKLSRTSKTLLGQIAAQVRWGAITAGRVDDYEHILLFLNAPEEMDIDQSWIDEFLRITTRHTAFIGTDCPFREEVDFITAEIKLLQKQERTGKFKARDWLSAW